MLLAEFQKCMNQWLLNEQQLANQSPSPDELVTQIAGNVSNIQRVLDIQSEGGGLLERTKRSVRRDISQNGATKVVLANFRSQSEQLTNIQGDIDTIEQDLQDLGDLIVKRPEKNLSTDAIEDASNALSDLRNNTPPKKNLREKASDKISDLTDALDTEEIEGFLDNQQNFSARRENRTTGYTIRELRPRYYTYQEADAEESEDTSDDYTLVGVNRKLNQISGYESVELQNDGTIIARGSNEGLVQHRQDTIQLQQSQTSSSQKPQKVGGESSVDLQSKIETAKDDNTHAYWACAVLDLVADAQEFIDGIRDKFDDLVDDFQTIPRRLVNGLVMEVAKQKQIQEATKALKDAKQGMDKILKDPEKNQSNILNIGNQLSIQPDSQPSLAACQNKHRAYCQTHSAFAKLWNDIKNQIPSVEKLGGSLQLPFDPEKKIDEIEKKFAEALQFLNEVDSALDTLQRDICYWVEQPVGGVPSSLNEVQVKIGKFKTSVGAIISSLPIQSLSQLVTTDLKSKSSKLQKAGYTRAANALAKGDIEEFLGMEEGDTTCAGKTAQTLHEASIEAEDPGRESRLNELQTTAEVRHEQRTSPQRVREEMRARLGNDPQKKQAELIQKEGTQIIGEIES